MDSGDPKPAGELFSLVGRSAVVTGGSGGLGERFARVLHAAGATVYVGARRGERLDSLAAELGERLVPVLCDVSLDADCEHLIEVVMRGSGTIDVLVNNAGTGAPVAAEDESMENFRRVLSVNVEGLFNLCRLSARHMLAQRQGSIVNVASMFGLVGSAPIKDAGYTASKGAVVNLTRELALQWAGRGVRVNALAPGWFPSEMTDALIADDASMRFVTRNCPMGRVGGAEELDGALLYLASNASSYMTGHVLTVDGGWTAR